MAKKASSAPKRTAKQKKKSTADSAQITAFAILLSLVVSICVFVLMYIDSGGVINSFVKKLLMGLFGKVAYAIPITSIGLSIYLFMRKDLHRFRLKFTLVFFILCDISAVTHLISVQSGARLIDAYQSGIDGSGGGLIGGFFAWIFQYLVNDIIAFVILLFVLLILISMTTRVSIFSAVFSFFKGTISDIRDDSQTIQRVDVSDKAVKMKKKLKSAPKHTADNTPIDLSLDLPELSDKPQSAPRKDVSVERVECPPIIDLPVTDADTDTDARAHIDDAKPSDDTIEDSAEGDEIKDVDELAAVFADGDNKNDINDTIPDDIFNFDISNSSSDNAEKSDDADLLDEIFKENDTAHTPTESNHGLDREKKITAEEKEMLNNEIENALEQKKEYVFPSLDFLTATASADTDTRHEMLETATRLIEILKNFGVDARLSQVTKGPTVTRYEIQPSVGTKLNKISNLADDIALNLAVQTVLIAPVPDKTTVGIEVPNKEVGSVYIRELIASDEFTKAKSKLSVVLGKDIGGKVVVGDIAKMPHVLIAGATGSGKSVCINTIITSILYKATPDEVKMIMVDPKVVELGVYNGIPHLLIPVVTDPKRAAASLNWAVQEMMKRYDIFAETGVKNLESYNKLAEKNGEGKMPQLVIIIDELADLMMVAAKEVEGYICRLAQLARAAGIHLIIATQRPSVDVITGLIKANVPSRIAFAVSSQVDSRTILDRGGADKLLGKGDMLYSPAGSRSPQRVQGAFVTDGEIEKIVTFLKETSEENFYSDDLADHIERCSTGENGVTPDEEDDGDSLLPQAIELAVSMGQISTSMIQRKFRIGYSRAGRIVDQMEARGIISGPNGSKPREVIIAHSDL